MWRGDRCCADVAPWARGTGLASPRAVATLEASAKLDHKGHKKSGFDSSVYGAPQVAQKTIY